MNGPHDMSICDSVMNMAGDDIRPFLSGYLTEGYREDDLVMKSVCFRGDSIDGQFSAEHAYIPGDGHGFHLSLISAANCISQLSIIFACLDSRMPEKPGEVYASDFSIQFKRPIRTRSFNIFLRRDEVEIRNRTKRYRVSGTVANGHFEYGMTFVFPR